MTETTAIVVSIVGTGIGIVAVMGLIVRTLTQQLSGIAKRIDDLKLDTTTRIDDLKADMNRQFTGVNSRLQHIETRIDDTNKRIDTVSRDLAELRDRTGTLEGTLSTFMNAGRSPNAA